MKELQPVLEQLAGKLGTTIEHLWFILQRQAYITGITKILLSLLVITADIILYKLFLNFF